MNTSPFFSVLIPTYEQAHYLADAIDGVLCQSFTDFEVLVLDDHSLDETPNVLKKYTQESRLRYIRRTDRLGRVKNYRQGVSDARGIWILMCDGDDYYTDPHFLQTAYDHIQQEGDELVLLQGGHWYGQELATASAQVPCIDLPVKGFNGVDYVLKFSQFRHFSHLSSVYKAEWIRKVEPYQLDILSSDMNTLLKLAIHGKVLLIRQPFGLWRQHHANASSSSSFAKRFENLLWIEDCCSYFRQHSELFPAQQVNSWRQEQILTKYVDFCIEALQLWRKEQNTEAVQLVLNKLKRESLRTLLQFIRQFLQRLWYKL